MRWEAPARWLRLPLLPKSLTWATTNTQEKARGCCLKLQDPKRSIQKAQSLQLDAIAITGVTAPRTTAKRVRFCVESVTDSIASYFSLYMLIIYTFIVFFVAESPLHLRSPPAETHDRNGTEVTGDSESSVRGGSMSDLKAHGMLVFVRGVAGLGMGYLMGLPMKRLMDGLEAVVVLDRVEKGEKVLEEAETIHGAEEHGVEQEGGREMTELKGGGKGSNTDDPSGRGESKGCSSCKGDEVVIDIDPVDAAQEKDGLLKRGRPTGR